MRRHLDFDQLPHSEISKRGEKAGWFFKFLSSCGYYVSKNEHKHQYPPTDPKDISLIHDHDDLVTSLASGTTAKCGFTLVFVLRCLGIRYPATTTATTHSYAW